MFRLKNLRASTFTDKTFATGSGYDPQNPITAIALPARKALRKYVRVTLPDVGTGVFPVLDVGTYLWWDDDFILHGNDPDRGDLCAGGPGLCAQSGFFIVLFQFSLICFASG